jgi:hypothetical protein
MQYVINLAAGIVAPMDVQGRFFLLEDTGAAASVALKFRGPGLADEEIGEARRGFKLSALQGAFQRVEILSTVAAQVRFIVSQNPVDIDVVDGANVTATITGLPLAVSNDRGTPGNLLHVTAVTVADAPAVAASSAAPVAVTSAGQVVAAANPARRALRICNLGPDPVAIGPAGATWAQRCVVLPVGDVWVEDRGANLAWSGICDAGKTASVTWQGVTA